MLSRDGAGSFRRAICVGHAAARIWNNVVVQKVEQIQISVTASQRQDCWVCMFMVAALLTKKFVCLLCARLS